MSTHQTIGIMGGQGPQSTADFYLRIVKYYQDDFGAKYIKDFPPMVILSIPSPDLITSVENEAVTYELMADAAKKLEAAGCDFIVIVCNSLQFLLERLQSLVKIPIIGIASIVAETVKSLGYNSVGILATDTTIRKNVYSQHLERYGINLILPKLPDQTLIQRAISHEISGEVSEEDRVSLKNSISNLQKAGAEAVLLACTELPLLIKQADVSTPLIDCNELYAQETAERSR